MTGAKPTQYCTFYVDDMLFGIDVERVQEVMRYHEMTRVPLAPREVEGLINLRGQIVTAIDLRRRLTVADRPADRPPMNVVIDTADGPVSVLVDRIGEVIEVQQDTFEVPPDMLQGAARELILGAHKLPGRLLLVLDIDRAVELSATVRGKAN
jgi:purine-binding chemotaxis protein CheW